MRLYNGKDAGFTIKRATDEDISACAGMVSKAMGGQQIDKGALEQTLKTPNILILVAKVQDKFVGMISGAAFPSIIPMPRIDFLGISDDESARKGLHGILIDEFVEELKRRLPKAKYVDTNVPAINFQFVAMYSLKGFVIAGFTKGEPPLGDTVVLRKNISK
ncbi:MAG: hypothetical protein V1850_03690 [Candidatus Bathyarchaeota archaeon]